MARGGAACESSETKLISPSYTKRPFRVSRLCQIARDEATAVTADALPLGLDDVVHLEAVLLESLLESVELALEQPDEPRLAHLPTVRSQSQLHGPSDRPRTLHACSHHSSSFLSHSRLEMSRHR